MKILVVCQHFYPEDFKINDICFTLKELGHDVTVLTGLPNYPEGKVLKDYRFFRKRKETIKGVRIIRASLTGRGKNNFTIALNYMTFAINSCIKSLFMKKDFDIILCYQLSPVSMAWPGIITKKIKKIPLVIYSLDLWPDSMLLGGIKEKSWQYNFFYRMSFNTYKYADKILVSSYEYIDYFKNELKLKNKKFYYLPNYSDIRDNTNYKKDKVFDILFAGNIGPAQNVELIVELAKKLKYNKNIFFHIVGDGLNKSKCESLASKYKLKNLKFYGRYREEEMFKFFNNADAFIITLVNNKVVNKCEPLKLSTYLSEGKPIFGAINGAVKKIVNENNCGLITEADDINGLYNAIINNYKNQKQLNIWSENCIKLYKKNYSKTQNIKKLINILKD